METPTVSGGGAKAEPPKAARDGKPPGVTDAHGRAKSHGAVHDITELSARSRAAATSRARTEDRAAEDDASSAEALAERTKRQILEAPARAAAAQANADGAAVLAMLQ